MATDEDGSARPDALRSDHGKSRFRLRSNGVAGDVPREASCAAVAASAPSASAPGSSRPSPSLLSEWRAVALLVLLYSLQGVPMGLAFGTFPFVLQSRSSYAKLGVFSLSSYPYSLKLLWSPIVDSVYSRRVGRRKSWIVPTQLLTGALMLAFSGALGRWSANGTVLPVTAVCFALVLLAATQDIAVDGWALTLLSEANMPYASTCQSLGLSVGYFASFTVFLALNNVDFCNRYVRDSRLWRRWWSASAPDVPILTLTSFLRICGVLFVALTLLIVLAGGHDDDDGDGRDGDDGDYYHHHDADGDEHSASKTYARLLEIVRKRPVRRLLVLLLVSKFCFAAHDNVASLQLLRRGFPKQNLAFMAVVQMPFELLGTLIVGRWARQRNPLSTRGPWQLGYLLRLALAFMAPLVVVRTVPRHRIAAASASVPLWYYSVLFVTSVAYQFASDGMMFVSIGSFFAQVSDPSIGGTYLTLLNTASNFGGTWPKALVFGAVDAYGFDAVALLLPLVGAVLYAVYLRRELRELSAVPRRAWHLDRQRGKKVA